MFLTDEALIMKKSLETVPSGEMNKDTIFFFSFEKNRLGIEG